MLYCLKTFQFRPKMASTLIDQSKIWTVLAKLYISQALTMVFMPSLRILDMCNMRNVLLNILRNASLNHPTISC